MRRLWAGVVLVLVAALVMVIGGSFGWPSMVRVVTGAARPADRLGETDEDQIRDTLRAISDSYNREDVKGAQSMLCAPAQSQWTDELERVWMRFRRDHGVMRFTVESVAVHGPVGDVTGTQQYANDAVPKRFTAKLGRSPHGWRLCSST